MENEKSPKRHIGALLWDSLNGVFLGGSRRGGLIRFGWVHEGRVYLDENSTYQRILRLGPCAPEGRYSQIEWEAGPEIIMSLEYTIEKDTVIGILRRRDEKEIPIHVLCEVSDIRFSAGEQKDSPEKSYIHTLPHTTKVLFSLPPKSTTTWGRGPWKITAGKIEECTETTNPDRLVCLFTPFTPQTRLFFKMTVDEADTPQSPKKGGLARERSEGEKMGNEKIPEIKVEENNRGLEEEITRILNIRREEWEKERTRGEEKMKGVPEAISDAMAWNALLVPELDMVFPSIDRKWAGRWGGWVVGEWDCFLGALATALDHPLLTENAIKGMFRCAGPGGMLPNIASGWGITPDRSQPPVASFCILKIDMRYPHLELGKKYLEPLLRWHLWWTKKENGSGNRRVKGDFLSWGSDPLPTKDWTCGSGNYICARFESGLDDSPMFDEAEYDPSTGCLNIHTIDLNALYALDSWCIARLARRVKREDIEKQMSEEYQTISEKISRYFWDSKRSVFTDRHWSGRFSEIPVVTHFYAFLADIEKHQIAAMAELLKNKEMFWGEFVIPTVAKTHPSFTDQDYWRGKIWGPTNYLVYQGLRKCGLYQLAGEVALKSLELFMLNWKNKNRYHENYFAHGPGGSLPRYTWGTLLALMAVEEFGDVCPFDGIHFGSMVLSGAIKDMKIGSHVYDINQNENGLFVKKDGRPIISTSGRVIIKNFDPNYDTFTLVTERPVGVMVPSTIKPRKSKESVHENAPENSQKTGPPITPIIPIPDGHLYHLKEGNHTFVKRHLL